MAIKWEYMYLEYDSTPDPNLSPAERMIDALKGERNVIRFFPMAQSPLFQLSQT